MRRRLILVAATALIAVAGVGSALAVARDGGAWANEPTITSSVFGPAQAGLDARMADAEKDGPYAITCSPGDGETLLCTEVKNGGTIAAIKRGKTVYGRTVVGFPGGASADDAVPMFEATDLVCLDAERAPWTCLPVTVATPSVRVGEEIVVSYKKYNITVHEDGRIEDTVGEPTVSLRVVAP